MKKLSKLVGSLALGFMVLCGGSKVANAGTNDVTAISNTASTSTFKARGIGANAAGRQVVNVGEELGWNVFESSASSTAGLVLDQNGKAPTCALVHKICNDSSASGFAVAYDTNSAAGITVGLSAGALGGRCPSSTTLQTCCTLDIKTEKGIVFGASTSVLNSYLYWAPCLRNNN